MRLKRASFCVERGSTCPLAVAVPPGAKSNANVKISPMNAPPAPWLGCGLTPVVTNAWVITSDDCLLSRGLCDMATSPTLRRGGGLGGLEMPPTWAWRNRIPSASAASREQHAMSLRATRIAMGAWTRQPWQQLRCRWRLVYADAPIRHA